MTAPRDLTSPGTIQKRPRFVTNTPEQCRQFRLLLLAMAVHAEDLGFGLQAGRSARAQAREALGIPGTAEGRKTTVDELITRLRDEAQAARLGG